MQAEVIKKILYDAVAEIGREKMQIEVRSDMGAAKKYINRLLFAYSSEIGLENQNAAPRFIEALLHLMLTISGVPSERRVNVDTAHLDIVIPSIRVLRKDPRKSLVIQIMDPDDPRVNESIKKFQPVDNNVWLVSEKPLITRYRNYSIVGEPSISNIIVDIIGFLRDSGVNGPRLIH